MKEIETYDIITLDNNEEYTVIKKINEQGKQYLLLAPVDEDENPDVESIKIVEQKNENNILKIVDVKNNDTLKRLSTTFLSELRKGLD